ncbi:MAG TPA: LEPR-XLL domain-containing protein, partial [Pseudomonadales bacterium]|nr:LEPR-XLL domain-containing protein [Pseudomonadales bacterium]
MSRKSSSRRPSATLQHSMAVFGRQVRSRLGEAIRQVGRLRPAAAAAPDASRRLLFEPLEPRLLLSADPLSYTVADTTQAANLTVRLVESAGTPTLQLYDSSSPDTVLASQALADTSRITITGTAFDDVLSIDLDSGLIGESLVVEFTDGGPDVDSVRLVGGAAADIAVALNDDASTTLTFDAGSIDIVGADRIQVDGAGQVDWV